jgi:hypothetical protein
MTRGRWVAKLIAIYGATANGELVDQELVTIIRGW